MISFPWNRTTSQGDAHANENTPESDSRDKDRRNCYKTRHVHNRLLWRRADILHGRDFYSLPQMQRTVWLGGHASNNRPIK